MARFFKGQIPWNKRRIDRVCALCKKEFTTSPSAMGKYCSRKCAGFKKGTIPWNKGIPYYYGAKHHSWKGGVTPINEKIRKSAKYRLWREAVFKRDNYTCVIGGKAHGSRLNADHIKPFSLYPELHFDITNGRTLCVDCHRVTDSFLNPHMRKEDYVYLE